MYQGKYIPTERTDGLLQQEESVNEEASIEEVICEESSMTSSKDIDSDYLKSEDYNLNKKHERCTSVFLLTNQLAESFNLLTFQ